jgi:hypothetical protein
MSFFPPLKMPDNSILREQHLNLESLNVSLGVSLSAPKNFTILSLPNLHPQPMDIRHNQDSVAMRIANLAKTLTLRDR